MQTLTLLLKLWSPLQEEVRRVVNVASRLGVMVIPELDLPVLNPPPWLNRCSKTTADNV